MIKAYKKFEEARSKENEDKLDYFGRYTREGWDIYGSKKND